MKALTNVILIIAMAMALLITGYQTARASDEQEKYEPVGKYDGFDSVKYWHDDKRKVSCWIVAGRGISCIPDSDLPPEAFE